MQESFWWCQCSDRYIVSLSSHLHTSLPPFSPSLISLMVSVDVKHHVYFIYPPSPSQCVCMWAASYSDATATLPRTPLPAAVLAVPQHKHCYRVVQCVANTKSASVVASGAVFHDVQFRLADDEQRPLPASLGAAYMSGNTCSTLIRQTPCDCGHGLNTVTAIWARKCMKSK